MLLHSEMLYQVVLSDYCAEQSCPSDCRRVVGNESAFGPSVPLGVHEVSRDTAWVIPHIHFDCASCTESIWLKSALPGIVIVKTSSAYVQRKCQAQGMAMPLSNGYPFTSDPVVCYR